MPRDSNGTYTLPAGNPVVTGTVIAAGWANPTMGDLGNEMTNSLDRQGRGGMLAPFKFLDGTAGAPGMTWTTEPTMGFFRAGASEMAATVAGVPRMRWTGTGVDIWDSVGANWSALPLDYTNFAKLDAANVFTLSQIVGGPTYSPVAASTKYLGVSNATGRVAVGAQSLAAALVRGELFADATPAVGIDWTYASGVSRFEFRRAGVEIFNFSDTAVSILNAKILTIYNTGNVNGRSLAVGAADMVVNSRGALFHWTDVALVNARVTVQTTTPGATAGAGQIVLVYE